MAVDETHETEPEHAEPLEPVEPEPDTDDEPGPSDDEQEAEAEDDEPTPEPEPEPEARGLSEKALADRDKKADQSFDTYTRRVATLYEEDAQDLIPCPLCLITPRGFVNRHSAGRLDPEHADLVKQFLGVARPIDLQPDPETKTCPTCQGEGKTATGSRVPNHTQRPCPKCKGYGYSPPPGAPQNGHVAEGAPQPLLSVVASDIDTGDVDDWREPRVLPDGRENPNFGKMPQFKIRVEPWGTTAGLTAQDAVTT